MTDSMPQNQKRIIVEAAPGGYLVITDVQVNKRDGSYNPPRTQPAQCHLLILKNIDDLFDWLADNMDLPEPKQLNGRSPGR